MAFNLKKVLKALLYSSSQPLAARDIQAVVERFHRQAAPPAGAEGPGAPAADLPEAPAEAPEAPELYEDVPALVTVAQIREAMEAIAAELALADDGLSVLGRVMVIALLT